MIREALMRWDESDPPPTPPNDIPHPTDGGDQGEGTGRMPLLFNVRPTPPLPPPPTPAPYPMPRPMQDKFRIVQ